MEREREGEGKKSNEKKKVEEGGRPIDCSFDLSAHTKPPLHQKKNGQGILTVSTAPPPSLLHPLSHPPHMVGQPMSWSRGLKAPTGRATIGLLQPREGKCSLSPSSPSLSFTVGRHCGSHYSALRVAADASGFDPVCVFQCVCVCEPCRKSSSPTECEMRRIKTYFPLTQA